MINFEDLDKAEENINKLRTLRDELINSSQYFDDMTSRIQWYKETCTEIPEQKDKILGLIEDPVLNTINLNPTNYNFQQTSGATGSFYASVPEVKDIIKTYGSKHYSLITKYDKLNATEELIERILNELKTFRSELLKYNPIGALLAVKDGYPKWKADITSNAVFAGEIRAFQDLFNGMLHMARLESYPKNEKRNTDESWPKMADALAKSGNGCQKSLRSLQGQDDKLHLTFTEIFKQTKTVTKLEMDDFFKQYIEQVYSIINLINHDLMK